MTDTPCEFAGGDIIFRRTPIPTFADLAANGDFANTFADLAAYAQTFPYVYATDASGSKDPADYRPWHHIDAIVSDPEGALSLVGFDSSLPYSSSGESPELTKTPMSDDDLEALREDIANDRAIVLRATDECVAKLNQELEPEQPPQPYSLPGLIAFAFATEMRMLPAGSVRDDVEQSAWKAHEVAVDNAKPMEPENCVTTVAKAVEAACGKLNFKELAPPLVPTGKLAAEQQLNRVQAVLDRVTGSQKVIGGQEIRKALTDGETARVGRVRTMVRGLEESYRDGIVQIHRDAGIDVSQLGGTEGLQVPSDLVKGIGEFLVVLEDITREFPDFDRPAPQQHTLSADSTLVSPAMLHEALVQKGFTSVCDKDDTATTS